MIRKPPLGAAVYTFLTPPLLKQERREGVVIGHDELFHDMVEVRFIGQQRVVLVSHYDIHRILDEREAATIAAAVAINL